MGASCSQDQPRSVMDRILEALADTPERRRQRLPASRRRRSASPPPSAVSPSSCLPPRRRRWGPKAGLSSSSASSSSSPASQSPRGAAWGRRRPAGPVVRDFAAVSTQNSKFRKHMEDECVAIPQFRAFGADPARCAFFGVYDGHGGGFCSKYAAAHFHQRLAAALEARVGAKRVEDAAAAACSNSSNRSNWSSMGTSNSSNSSNLSNVSTSNSSNSSNLSNMNSNLQSGAEPASSLDGDGDENGDVLSSQDVARCYAEAFAMLDKELEQFDESSWSGSTAVTCLVRRLRGGRARVHVANVGDSRAVLFAGGRTTRLSVDHKAATNEDEVRRIRALNGIVVNKRVAGSISVTRALGQADEKRFITSAPHVASVDVASVDVSAAVSFLVLVSDGVSDVFSDEQLTAFVAPRLAAGRGALAVCKDLLDEAKLQGAMDNMTAVLVRLDAAAAGPGHHLPHY